MPYLAHFGLKDHPFTLTPNIDYYFPTQETANIVASLEFALRRDTGIIKVVGEVGTGKTLLCRLLMHKLVDTERVAYINAPQADARSIVRTVCEEFGIDPGSDEGTPFSALNHFLVEEHVQNRLAVVVVDEAQHLGKEGLEAIRLISNLETEKNKLLQIVLFGQTELDELLKDPSLRQLNQRVVFSFTTKPLTAGEVKRYVAHRIRVSRKEGIVYDIFSDGALALVAKQSGGIPRVVNILSDKSLLVAFSAGSPIVQKAHAAEAVRDTPNLIARSSFHPFAWIGQLSGRAVAWTMAGFAVLAAAAGGYYVARLGAPQTAPPPVASAPLLVPAPAQVAAAAPVVAPTPVAVAPAPAPVAVAAPVVAPVVAPPPVVVAPAPVAVAPAPVAVAAPAPVAAPPPVVRVTPPPPVAASPAAFTAPTAVASPAPVPAVQPVHVAARKPVHHHHVVKHFAPRQTTVADRSSPPPAQPPFVASPEQPAEPMIDNSYGLLPVPVRILPLPDPPVGSFEGDKR
jgi:type II secretory pathway predicted ATPase ExeA